MRHTPPVRHAFTLIEMVIVLAIMGVALAIVAPAMVLPKNQITLATIISESRSAAIRRSEQISLAVAEDGKWRMYAPRSGTTAVRSGLLDEKFTGAVTIQISPLGMCTVDFSKQAPRVTLDPFDCALVSSRGARR